ncbi:pumilio-like protein 6 [Hibiscus syriacus]|uniref:Pumilio-like protein 6 n=1 Tax=Hibiscus syriacus TaxID=106335 RepID=A0A6A3AFR9_HIBSY|nr:pumilio-like protein 6 [Hibiscus syriacus]
MAKLSERALELLALPDDGVPRLLLDIGCGSGLSGETLTENGHQWIGLDISPSMLCRHAHDVALRNEVEGDLLLGDMGQGLGLRPGIIDGAISISAVQWLCNADKSSHEPRLRLKCLARAMLQEYPENPAQPELILSYAMRAGFAGGVVVDYPHSVGKVIILERVAPMTTRAAEMKKTRRTLLVASAAATAIATTATTNIIVVFSGNLQVSISDRHRPRKKQKINKRGKGREWVLRKKEQMRRKGNIVPRDTNYTARKRKARF